MGWDASGLVVGYKGNKGYVCMAVLGKSERGATMETGQSKGRVGARERKTGEESAREARPAGCMDKGPCKLAMHIVRPLVLGFGSWVLGSLELGLCFGWSWFATVGGPSACKMGLALGFNGP